MRSSSLTRAYSSKERKIINNSINERGDIDEIVAMCGTDTIWFNHEIILQFTICCQFGTNNCV